MVARPSSHHRLRIRRRHRRRRRTLLAGGEILISQDSGSGAAVGALTNSGRTLVQGFLPYDYQATDNDTDGVLDMAELYVNEYTLMLRP